MLRHVLISLSTAAALALSGVAAADQEPVRIGAFVSATGPASYLGDPQRKTLELMIGRINEEGGVLGRPLELSLYDDQSGPDRARSYARRLLARDNAHVLIGGTTTGATMAVVELAERLERPFISMAGAIVIIDPVRKWVFKTPETDRMAVQQIYEDMTRRGISRIALVSGTDGFGASGREQSRAVAADYGIEIIEDETYAPADSDMSAQLTRIRGNGDVEAVLVFGFGGGPAIVSRNARDLGMEPPIYQSHGVASENFLELAGSAAEGIRMPVSPILVAELLPDEDPQKGPAMDYLSAYQEAYGERPSPFGGYAYDALMIAVDAMERAGSTDPHELRDAIEQTSGLQGVTGTYDMSPEDHMGLDIETSFRMVEIRDGTWQLITD